MRFLLPFFLLVFIPFSGNAFTPQKDTSALRSGVNLMAGGYALDYVTGFQVGGEIFANKRKFQLEAQGFAKFWNNRPDYQLSVLFGRQANFHPKVYGVLSVGAGCEFENNVRVTPVYGNYGVIIGTKTTYLKSQDWGAKVQLEIFEKAPGFTIGQFVSIFGGESYKDIEFGILLTLGDK